MPALSVRITTTRTMTGAYGTQPTWEALQDWARYDPAALQALDAPKVASGSSIGQRGRRDVLVCPRPTNDR